VLTAGTRLVGLLGSPVGQSLSPRMHNAAFAALGLDWAYVALDVSPDSLAAAIKGLVATGFGGANVTAPHKLAAAQLVTTELVSVNTLVFEGDHAYGHSTDAAILAGLVAENPVVVGGGGSARAFLGALPSARNYSRRASWPPRVEGADLVVHATPVREEVLFRLGPGQTLIDLPYPESVTASAAREAGAHVIDGLDVLVAQGAAAFELWTGLPAPLGVMRAAVRS